MATLLNNRKASFNYELLERLEAGIELVGSEVKSLRAGRGSLDGAYVLVREGEAWLIGMTISPYQPGNAAGAVEQLRERKLLLTKQEIAHLAGLQNLTIVPISVYNKGRKIKLEIALARGKKKFDKRQTLKKRDTERNVRREHSDR